MTTRELPGDTDAVELLSSPPTTDDLDELLEAAAPRRRSKLTIGLAVALVFVVGFLAGSVSEKLAVSVQEAQSATHDSPEEDVATMDANPVAVGHVLMVDGGVLYVSRADGATLKVAVSDGTVVGLSEPARIDDLSPGDAVSVYGEIIEDGSVVASSIQQSHPGP